MSIYDTGDPYQDWVRLGDKPPAPEPVPVEELTYDERRALAPEYHQPVWDGLGEPHSWICAVCWDDELQTSWPCEVARARGKEVAKAGGMEWHA